MYNPLSPDQFGATVTAAATGAKAYQNGATAWEATNVGLWWRWWYKNLTFSFFIVFVLWGTAFFGGLNYGPLQVLAVIQVALTVWVFSLTYVSLVDASAGFKQRLWYRLWAPIQHNWFPNVARFWWYASTLFPMWLTLWFVSFFLNKTGIQPSHSVPPEWQH